MPLLYQQSKTPPLPEATWGMHILVVWNKTAREQFITNNPSWLEIAYFYWVKQDPSPAAIWNLKTQAPYLFLNHQLKGYCQEWQIYVGSPKTHKTKLMRTLAAPPIHKSKSPLIIRSDNACVGLWEITDGSCITNKENILVVWSRSVPPSFQQNHHSKSWRDKHKKNINRLELAGIVAALINEHTHTATGSAGALWQTRNRILYPQRKKRHKHAKLLETIVHHFQLF